MPFVTKDMYSTSHIFLGPDSSRCRRQSPYTELHLVVPRSSQIFTIRQNGCDKTDSIDHLKLAHIDSAVPTFERPIIPVSNSKAPTLLWPLQQQKRICLNGSVRKVGGGWGLCSSISRRQ